MAVRLNDITLEKFKAYNEKQSIDLSDINILMGGEQQWKKQLYPKPACIKADLRKRAGAYRFTAQWKVCDIGLFFRCCE